MVLGLCFKKESESFTYILEIFREDVIYDVRDKRQDNLGYTKGKYLGVAEGDEGKWTMSWPSLSSLDASILFEYFHNKNFENS